MEDDKFMQLLTDNSTLKYHIKYEKYFFNHISQGLIALKFLDGDESDFSKFLEWYTKDLIQADKCRTEEDASELKDLNEEVFLKKLKTIRGQNRYFYFLVSYFETLLKDKYNGDLIGLVVNEYIKSQLYAGLLGSAFHSLIQIGYGMTVNHPRIVCEGLAFAITGYFGLKDDQSIDDIGCGEKDLFDVLDDLRTDDELKSYLAKECDKLQESIIDNGRLFTFLEILYGTRQDVLVKFAQEVKISFPENNEGSCLSSFLDSLIGICVSLFVRSKTKCDFFFLHGVTSAWALKKLILKVCEQISLNEVNNLTKVFVCALLGVYLARNTPELISEVEIGLGIEERSWSDIIKDTKALARDEHVYKIIMTCCNTDLSTSIEGKGATNIYKLASEIALKYDLFVH